MSEKEETLESQATVHFTLPLFQKIIALVYPKLLFFFRPHSMTCGILVPQPGIESACSALEMWSLNYWITKKVLVYAKVLRSFSSVKGHLKFRFRIYYHSK